jgi:hypothetical protein
MENALPKIEYYVDAISKFAFCLKRFYGFFPFLARSHIHNQFEFLKGQKYKLI